MTRSPIRGAGRTCARWLLLPLLFVGCGGRPRHYDPSESGASAPKGDEPRLVELDLTAGAPETIDSGTLFHLAAGQSYTGLVRSIERAASDDKIRGLFVRLGEASFDLAESEELSSLLSKVRAKGKPVVCHAHELNNASALLTDRGCSAVWLSPAGEVSTIGIAAQMVYLHGIFDKLKVDVDFLHVGKFKSGPEPLTREGPSEEARTSLVETLAAIRAAWLTESNESRKNDALADALEHGPWSSGEARVRGLIDEIGFETEALDAAKKAAKVTVSEASFGPRAKSGGGLDIGDLLHLLAGSGSGSNKPHIAVVPAEGSITMEPGGPLQQGGITARALGKTLRRMQKDDSVKAVVLRIDSPGGSPLASDLIWHEMMELRKRKPIIVSVGNMAASGGYYIACAGQRIFAERASIVGSIGVFGGKINVAPALEQFGIHAETFAASPEPGAAERAAFNSPLTAWDDATRERVRTQMQSIYDLFIARVAHGRHMEVDKVRASAEGHIWSGDQGLERGLVDEIGGLSEALAAARKAAHLDADAQVTVEGGRESLLDSLLVGDDASDADAAVAWQQLSTSAGARLLAEVPVELRPVIGSFAPLAAHEHVTAALPYALFIH
ncbi:MAG TPA: signal peptide peptidase SppA [Polyangiaceae bacterium]|jgi:protease-4|nr:signal peptide peptidase SppA [Polyangiaceae bacterium]